MGENIVVIHHIDRVRANSLLFCDHQDTESALFEIYISVFKPKYTKKNTRGSMGQQYL